MTLCSIFAHFPYILKYFSLSSSPIPYTLSFCKKMKATVFEHNDLHPIYNDNQFRAGCIKIRQFCETTKVFPRKVQTSPPFDICQGFCVRTHK